MCLLNSGNGREKTIFIMIAAAAALLTINCSVNTSLKQPQFGDTIRIDSNQPIKIALWVSTSGSNTGLGKDMKQYVEYAIDDMGGSIKGHRIKIQTYDSGCSKTGGEKAAKKMAKDPQIVAAIGPSCSIASKSGAPILWSKRIPTISPSATVPFLTAPNRNKDYDGFLRTINNDKYQGIIAATFAYHKLGARRVAVINDGSWYAKNLQHSFVTKFISLGGSVISRTQIAPGLKGIKAAITKIASQKPDVLYFPVFIAESASITKLAKKTEGLNQTHLMSSDGSYAPRFLKKAGSSCEGMYFSCPDFFDFEPEYHVYLKKFKKKYGRSPVTPYHANAYDAAKILLTAIDRVAEKSENNTMTIDRNRLKTELHKIKNLKGLTGNLNCDQYGDCGVLRFVVYKITKSNIQKKFLPKKAYWKPN